MNDTILNSVVDKKNNNLTTRFVVTGIIAIIVIVSVMTLRGYYVLRSTGVETEGQRIALKVSEMVAMVSNNADKIEGHHVLRIGESFKHLNRIESATIFTLNLQPFWPKTSATPLSIAEKQVVTALLSDLNLDGQVIDLSFRSLSTWVDGPLGRSKVLPVLIKLKGPDGKVFSIARIDYNFEDVLDYARFFGFRVLVFTLLCSTILFLALYYTFRRGIKTIEQQEKKLNHQISRLSNLLSINKLMQQSMKTASARAVELNEQFLRRVGADLHDGPAQMIGFAVMRLHQVSKQEAAKMFGQEFHAVKDALDNSLEEIRGISSGLVLPELEKLSLEECLRKVIALNSAKSDAEVAQYYQELPGNIPLPVKICAYRFIQEGLNNAHRHGGAKKCRLSAYVNRQELVISLKDNGIGFRKSKLKEGGAHLGLVGLKDRIESIGGSFSINSELGVGTALKLTISLADDA
ncbi:MAG: signal transduction histidine kinase [Arenicella sp.]|jgi:signal transduction histidine kinase